MPAPDAIACDKLTKMIGTPKMPVLLDVRPQSRDEPDNRMIPTARPLTDAEVTLEALPRLAAELRGQSVIVACTHGQNRSQGVAAWLRQAGIAAEYLDGGVMAWLAGGYPALPTPPGPDMLAANGTYRRNVDGLCFSWII